MCEIFAATNLFKMLLKYRPEDKAEKKERLLKRAQAEADGKPVEAKKPIVVKYGLNHVTYLIEQVFFSLFFFIVAIFVVVVAIVNCGVKVLNCGCGYYNP